MIAHALVISRDPSPSTRQIAKLAPGLGDMNWSWIAAGPDRAPDCIEGRPAIRDAGGVGLLAGRQRALEVAADADILIYLDDDVALPPGWAVKMIEPFSNSEVQLAGCRYLPDYAGPAPPWLKEMWRSEEGGFRTIAQLSLLDGGDAPRFHSPMLVWGLCFAIRREAVIKLGGFNPDGYPWPLRRYRGDGESGLASRAKQLGLKAFYQGQTHVLHAVPAERMTPKYFARRSFLQGISDSYSLIRSSGATPPPPLPSWKDWLRPARTKLDEVLAEIRPTSANVRRLMARAYLAGQAYHQAQVRHDPHLLAWVVKAHYGDGRLPDETTALSVAA